LKLVARRNIFNILKKQYLVAISKYMKEKEEEKKRRPRQGAIKQPDMPVILVLSLKIVDIHSLPILNLDKALTSDNIIIIK